MKKFVPTLPGAMVFLGVCLLIHVAYLAIVAVVDARGPHYRYGSSSGYATRTDIETGRSEISGAGGWEPRY